MERIFLFVFIIIMFLLGIYYCGYSAEGFQSASTAPRCPTILVQKDKAFYLYNPSVAEVPGVNPIQFSNLEEYVEFVEWQRSQGINCPVLYLQNSYDTQGNSVYKVRPSVTDLQGGLPPTANPNPTLLVDATRNDFPYNTNSHPGFDASSYYVGTTTPLDQMNQQAQQNMLYSGNPMDENWGGATYTQSLVDKGVYAGNEVSIQV
jgi:hypothetical protein